MNFTKDDLYKYCVLAVINDIHTYVTGTDDSSDWFYSTRDERVAWLEWRLTSGWIPNRYSKTAQFDDIVNLLGLQALKDYYNYMQSNKE